MWKQCIGSLPSWAHSLVGKRGQHANRSRNVGRITGVCRGAQLGLETLRALIWKDEWRMPRGWRAIPEERLQLAKEHCLRTMARLEKILRRE